MMGGLQFLVGLSLMWMPLVLGGRVSLLLVMWGSLWIGLIVWLPLSAVMAIGALLLADGRAVRRHGHHHRRLLYWVLLLSIALPILSGIFIASARYLDRIRAAEFMASDND